MPDWRDWRDWLKKAYGGATSEGVTIPMSRELLRRRPFVIPQTEEQIEQAGRAGFLSREEVEQRRGQLPKYQPRTTPLGKLQAIGLAPPEFRELPQTPVSAAKTIGGAALVSMPYVEAWGLLSATRGVAARVAQTVISPMYALEKAPSWGWGLLKRGVGKIQTNALSSLIARSTMPDDVLVRTNQFGRATYGVFTGDVKGVVVGSYPERALKVEGEVTADVIKGFMQKNADLLKNPSKAVNVVGKELNVVDVAPDREMALRIARSKGLKSVFDIDVGQEIATRQPQVDKLIKTEAFQDFIHQMEAMYDERVVFLDKPWQESIHIDDVLSVGIRGVPAFVDKNSFMKGLIVTLSEQQRQLFRQPQMLPKTPETAKILALKMARSFTDAYEEAVGKQGVHPYDMDLILQGFGQSVPERPPLSQGAVGAKTEKVITKPISKPIVTETTEFLSRNWDKNMSVVRRRLLAREAGVKVGNKLWKSLTDTEKSQVAQAFSISGMPDDELVKTTVKEVADAIKSAKTNRKFIETVRSQQLGQRVARIEKIMARKDLTAAEKDVLQRQALAGEYAKGAFESLRTKFTPEEVTKKLELLHEAIQKSPLLLRLEKVNAGTALNKLFNPDAGVIPGGYELEQLEKVLGSDIIDVVLAKRTMGAKFWEGLIEFMNLSRAIMASGDLSAVLRQAGFLLWGHPQETFPNVSDYIRAIISGKYARSIDGSIREGMIELGAFVTKHWGAQIGAEVRRLYIAPLGRAASLTQREEAFISRLLQRFKAPKALKFLELPTQFVKRSEEGYITYLNKTRFDIYKSIVIGWKGTTKTVKDFADLADYINVASGRGHIESITQMLPVLNAFFFSPRLIMSRLQLPAGLFHWSPAVRKIAAKDLSLFVGVNSAILALASTFPGVTIEHDPRSADAGKMRVGNTRVDFWAGWQPFVKFASQFITGRRKAQSGRVRPVNRAELLLQFIRTKLAPVPSVLTDLLSGSTWIGEPLPDDRAKLVKYTIEHLAPLFAQDVMDAAEDIGLEATSVIVPSIMGANVQTYESIHPLIGDFFTTLNRYEIHEQKINDLLKEGKNKEADRYASRHQELNLQYDPKNQRFYSTTKRSLYGVATEIRRLQDTIKAIEADKTITEEQRKDFLDEANYRLTKMTVDVMISLDRYELELQGIIEQKRRTP